MKYVPLNRTPSLAAFDGTQRTEFVPRARSASPWRGAVRAAAARGALSAAIAASSACTAPPPSIDASLVITVSGEATGRSGYPFPPPTGDAVGFVDGWALSFDSLVVSIGEVTLSDTPDLAPTDQSRTGAVVARARGPWVVELAKPGKVVAPALGVASLRALGGAEGIPSVGRGSAGDEAVRLVTFDRLNVAGKPLDAATRYAIGYTLAPVQAAATKLNFDADGGAALLAEMEREGAVLAYVGRATWKGAACRSSDSAYDWSALPTTVPFKFLFKTPVAFANCQNPELDGKPFDGEEKQRGVQVKDGVATFAELTFHNDHAFWLTADHEAASPFFDAIAAAAVPGGPVTLESLAELDPTAFKDRAGRALPWRSCVAPVSVPAGARRVDAGSFPASFDKSRGPTEALRNYAEVVAYLAAAQGHLNGDGLCAVSRRYPSP